MPLWHWAMKIYWEPYETHWWIHCWDSVHHIAQYLPWGWRTWFHLSVLLRRTLLSSLICELLKEKLILHCHCPGCMEMDLNLTKQKVAALKLGRWSRRISSYELLKIHRKLELKGICQSQPPPSRGQRSIGENLTRIRRQNLLCCVLSFLWRVLQDWRLCSGDRAAGLRQLLSGPGLQRHHPPWTSSLRESSSDWNAPFPKSQGR